MSAIETYLHAKRDLREAKGWASLLGKRYRGGGGGYGNIVNPNVVFDIYHQEYDGATNYHAIPLRLRHFMNMALVAHGSQIIDDAIKLMEADLVDIAKSAQKEIDNINADASGER